MKNPGFTGWIVLCLTLGIGATSAVFSILSTALLRPLPYRDADRIVVISESRKGDDGKLQTFLVSPASYTAWTRGNRVFANLGAVQSKSFNVTGSGEPIRLSGAASSSSFFKVLAVQPLKGRGFLPEEDRPGGGKAVLLSYGLWQRLYGSSPAAVGSTILLDGIPHQVIGVMPAEFRYPQDADLWVPLALENKAPSNHFRFLHVVARLAPGVTLEKARVEMQVLTSRIGREDSFLDSDWSAETTSLREYLFGNVQMLLITLTTAVGFVLLIACINVANLLLARTHRQSREIAIRSALGATPRRVIQQLLIESVVLSVLGGGLGLVLAPLGVKALIAISPQELAVFKNVEIDPSIMVFGILAAAVTGIIFGLVPAFRNSRVDLPLLRQGARLLVGSRRSRHLQDSLVVAEIALAVLLLVCAGLVIRSYYNLQRVNLGFHPERLLTVRLSLPSSVYPERHQRVALFEQILQRIRVLPGVVGAGATTTLPASLTPFSVAFTVEGRPIQRSEGPLVAEGRMVTAGYLEAMGISPVAGRMIRATDDAKAPGIVVISAELAKRFWPGRDTLGRRIRRGGPEPENQNPWLTVVGVLHDVRDLGPNAEIGPTLYMPFTQQDFKSMSIVVRTTSDPLALASSVRDQMRIVDHRLPLYEVATMEQLLATSTANQRFSATLLSLLALVVLLLAVGGVYGVMSYSVSQRVNEIGIRMALGASLREVMAMILRQGLGLGLLGLAIGLVGALASTRLIIHLLYQVSPSDPLTLACVSVVLIASATLAAYVPAHKAARIDPAVVLKKD